MAPCGDRERGVSLLEAVFVAGIVATASAMAVPSLQSAVDHARAGSAARYLAGLLREARLEAVKRSAYVAVQFVTGPDGYVHSLHVDGNGDGVRREDIERGLDLEIRPPESLSAHFPHVGFGALDGLPSPDAGGVPPGDDPVRIGNSDLLSFSPLGSSTSGSLYLKGRTGVQYVVRVLGETGRVRILRFDRARRRWRTL